mmetsp:Transcript_152254/g.283675  ORF Transcript_152254/g.283675 Transcript_152254/m.283675 type:complete len:226 (-) Transcript_152254:32-709(-)
MGTALSNEAVQCTSMTTICRAETICLPEETSSLSICIPRSESRKKRSKQEAEEEEDVQCSPMSTMSAMCTPEELDGKPPALVGMSICMPQSESRRAKGSTEEGSARAQMSLLEEEDAEFEGTAVEDCPETSHPVAMNTFDKLTQIHLEIHQQLALQESIIQGLLKEGDALDAIPEPVDSLAARTTSRSSRSPDSGPVIPPDKQKKVSARSDGKGVADGSGWKKTF